MPKARRLWTSFAKGELSPRIEGRPDLQIYYEGASEATNFSLLRQSGLMRRPGTRFVSFVRFPYADSVLIPFESSVNVTYIVEIIGGHSVGLTGRMRFYRNKKIIIDPEGPGLPFELPCPYLNEDIRFIHFTQSVDVMYLFHEAYPQMRLSSAGDTDWSLNVIKYLPPPSFEADSDIESGNLIKTNTSGRTIVFACTAFAYPKGFVTADVGRQIISGTSRAVIRSVSDRQTVIVDILDPFDDLEPIPQGEWFLRNSPQSELRPDQTRPAGASVGLFSTTDTFRPTDIGKYVLIYGGIVRIDTFLTDKEVRGELLSVMQDTDKDEPDPAPAGSWFLEEASWSDKYGYPRTGEFHSGRLCQASTPTQPTTFWLSRPDDFENYAVGSLPDDALEFTITSRQLNSIEWLADNINLFMGTTGAELTIKGGDRDQPISGDVIPLVQNLTTVGSMPVQPCIISRRIVFVDRSRRQIYSMAYNIEEDGFDAIELTDVADHITESNVKFGPIAYQKRRDPRVYFVLENGELIVLTYHHHQKVIGFTRYKTLGKYMSVACIAQTNKADEVWVVVKRPNIRSETIEVFDEDASELVSREDRQLQTDCAFVYKGPPVNKIDAHPLEGQFVDVVADGSYLGRKQVILGFVNLDGFFSEVEVGLPFTSKVTTMKPAIEGTVIEGLPRSWDQIWLRLLNSRGGKINGDMIKYPYSAHIDRELYTGDVQITGNLNWDTSGKLTIEQDQPYPLTILSIFGDLSVGDHG